MWQLFREGSKEAFEYIYSREYDCLLAYAKGFTQDISIIEDMIHDTFVYLWKNKDSLSDCNNIRPYLLVALRNRLIRSIKKASRTELKENNDSFQEYEDSIEERISNEEFNVEMSGKLNEAFKVLSERQKEAIFLRYMESMAYEDICNIMDINNQSVRNLISKGIKKLAIHFRKKT